MPENEKPNLGPAPSHGGIAERLDAIGWAFFFVWVGAALLLDVGWGLGLLGIGIIALGEQAARRFNGLKVEGFWIVVGCLFLLGGLSEILDVELPLLPILLIGAGLVVLFSALGGKHITRRFSK